MFIFISYLCSYLILSYLDFGLKEDEERQLSPALENIIDMMTSSGENNDDDYDDDIVM